MTTSPSFEYVRLAIMVMKWAPSYDDLLQWWKEEKPNREKWRLSPVQDPGRKLLEAFNSKRNELMETQQ